MLFSIHLDPRLRVAQVTMRFVECAVASIEDVHFRVCQLRVAMSIDLAIFFTNEFCPVWVSVCTRYKEVNKLTSRVHGVQKTRSVISEQC